MATRTRKTYTEARRLKILAAAQTGSLTALEVQKRFGVTPVTYYSWRKKRGITGPRGRRPANQSAPGGSDLSSQVRAGVQSRVREILPGIVREEVAGYLDALFGGTKSKRRRQSIRKK
jgi:transposase-like protein